MPFTFQGIFLLVWAQYQKAKRIALISRTRIFSGYNKKVKRVEKQHEPSSRLMVLSSIGHVIAAVHVVDPGINRCFHCEFYSSSGRQTIIFQIINL